MKAKDSRSSLVTFWNESLPIAFELKFQFNFDETARIFPK